MKHTIVMGLTMLAACSAQPTAPSGEGVCWRMAPVAEDEARFEVLGRDVPNLESCAALLDGARMMDGGEVTGAFNGHFIFATDAQITSAGSMTGSRIRVFEDEDLAKVREGLRALIRQRAPTAETEDREAQPSG